MRSRRIEFTGAVYHAIQRGNNKELIFRSNSDRQFFLAELVNSKKQFGFKLFGYVLLDNHYHLLLQVGDMPLSKIMQRQNSLYSRYYNRTYERTGHLFGIRYKASIIHDEKYLFTVLRYIHWNPIRAGLVSSVSDYKWSSDSYYRKGKAGLVDTDFILNSISTNRKYAIKEYLRLIQDENAVGYDSIDYSGDDTFDDSIKRSAELAGIKSVSLDDILISTGVSSLEFDLIKKGSRKRNLKSFKVAYVQEAIKQGYNTFEIASNVKLTPSAIVLLKNSIIEKQ